MMKLGDLLDALRSSKNITIKLYDKDLEEDKAGLLLITFEHPGHICPRDEKYGYDCLDDDLLEKKVICLEINTINHISITIDKNCAEAGSDEEIGSEETPTEPDNNETENP